MTRYLPGDTLRFAAEHPVIRARREEFQESVRQARAQGLTVRADREGWWIKKRHGSRALGVWTPPEIQHRCAASVRDGTSSVLGDMDC